MKLVVLGSGALLLIGVVGVALLFLLLPFQYQWFQRRWNQQAVQHYELETMWASGMSRGHVLAEVRDNRIVAGVDLDTGQPLNPNKPLAASAYVSIDNLFLIIRKQYRPATSWRSQLARYDRGLALKLDPCAAPLPNISYDAEFGYPTSINYQASPCMLPFNGANLFLTIARFRPLP